MLRNKAALKICWLAMQIIEPQIDLLEGCRKISKLSYQLSNSNVDRIKENLLFIRGVSSESDRFALGKVRDTCSADHLAKLDIEKEEFIAFYKNNVLSACRAIIELLK